MRRFIIPLSVFLIVFVGNSCVSKKKFVEMQDGRLKAEQEVRNLTDRVSTMINDFEIMKTELMGSNAMKDQYIDSLNQEITRLSGNLTKQDQSLAEKEFALDFEKKKLTSDLNERDKQIKQLELQLASLQNDLIEQTKELEDKTFNLNVAQDKITSLESDKKTADQNLADLQAKLKQAAGEISQLRSEGKKKDETITRLENNVKLLKEEMGKK